MDGAFALTLWTMIWSTLLGMAITGVISPLCTVVGVLFDSAQKSRVQGGQAFYTKLASWFLRRSKDFWNWLRTRPPWRAWLKPFLVFGSDLLKALHYVVVLRGPTVVKESIKTLELNRLMASTVICCASCGLVLLLYLLYPLEWVSLRVEVQFPNGNPEIAQYAFVMIPAGVFGTMLIPLWRSIVLDK